MEALTIVLYQDQGGFLHLHEQGSDGCWSVAPTGMLSTFLRDAVEVAFGGAEESWAAEDWLEEGPPADWHAVAECVIEDARIALTIDRPLERPTTHTQLGVPSAYEYLGVPQWLDMEDYPPTEDEEDPPPTPPPNWPME